MVGISSSYFASLGCGIYESVERAVDLGFRHVELGANHDYEDDVFQVLKKIKREFGRDVSFSVHGYFPPIYKRPYLFNVGEGLTEENRKVVDEMLRVGEVLGVEIAGFHPGLNNYMKYVGELRNFPGFKKFINGGAIDGKRAVSNVYEVFKFICRKAKKTGIKVCIENIYIADEMKNGVEMSLNGHDDFRRILDEIDSLYFLYDYGHAYIEEADKDVYFKFREKIIEVHLSGVIKGSDHFSIFKGEYNLEEVVSKVKKYCDDPLLVLEYSGGVSESDVEREKRMIESIVG